MTEKIKTVLTEISWDSVIMYRLPVKAFVKLFRECQCLFIYLLDKDSDVSDMAEFHGLSVYLNSTLVDSYANRSSKSLSLPQTNSGMLPPNTEIYKACCVNFRETTCVL